jgi:hypothetical protein
VVTNNNKAIQALTTKFGDIFREELPQKLPQ